MNSLQKKDHVSEDRGSFAHVRGWEEVGGLHVVGNHQEGNCHVSITSLQQWKLSDICPTTQALCVWSSGPWWWPPATSRPSPNPGRCRARWDQIACQWPPDLLLASLQVNWGCMCVHEWSLRARVRTHTCLSIFRLPCQSLLSFGSRVIWRGLCWSSNPSWVCPSHFAFASLVRN